MNEKSDNVVVCRDGAFIEAQNQVQTQKELLYVEMDEDSVTATNQEHHEGNKPSCESRSHNYPSQLRQPLIRFGKDEYVSIAIKNGSISSDNNSTEPTILKETLLSKDSERWKVSGRRGIPISHGLGNEVTEKDLYVDSST